jgi:DNA mismatch endonuclease (patch repair protein)
MAYLDVTVAPVGAYSLGIRRSMQANRGRDTRLEIGVRSLVYRAGLRYRVNARIDAGRLIRPDIVFSRDRLAVFLDGCFWHCCRLHRSIPQTNRGFWTAKLEANERRDKAATICLSAAGWNVLRIWEHEGLARSAEIIVQRVLQQRATVGRQVTGPRRQEGVKTCQTHDCAIQANS